MAPAKTSLSDSFITPIDSGKNTQKRNFIPCSLRKQLRMFIQSGNSSLPIRKITTASDSLNLVSFKSTNEVVWRYSHDRKINSALFLKNQLRSSARFNNLRKQISKKFSTSSLFQPSLPIITFV